MRILACLGVAVLLSLSVKAYAADNKIVAKEAYREGTRQYDLGEYRAALEAFKRAYLAFEEPAFLFNIAQCQRQLGDKVEAVRFYRIFLRKVPAAPNREEVQRLIASLDEAISRDRTTRAVPPQGTLDPSGKPMQPAVEDKPVEVRPSDRSAAAAVVEKRSDRAPTPIYKKWWLWTAVGGVALGVVLGVGLGVGLSGSAPSSHFGTTGVF